MASKNVVIGAAIAVALGGSALYLAFGPGATPPPVSPVATPKSSAAPPTMSDEERRQYVKDHVVLDNVVVDADTKPGEDGKDVVVPGLLRCTGNVVNKGDRAVTPVNLRLLLKGAADAVLGAYFEDVSGQKPLEPGASRAFKFTLPDKKDWSGQFSTSLE